MNESTESSVLDELIRIFTSMHLNTIRYEKHFECMADIMVNEKWEDWQKLVFSAKECEQNTAKICKNLRDINILLGNDSIKKLSGD